MLPSLTRYLNNTVFVSIPGLFEDGTARPYTLFAVELNGLWLQSDQLTARLLGDEGHQLARLNPAVFVPFAQIAGVVVATSMPESPAPEPPNNAPKPRVARETRPRTTPADLRRGSKR
jgi:hypothetical protein